MYAREHYYIIIILPFLSKFILWEPLEGILLPGIPFLHITQKSLLTFLTFDLLPFDLFDLLHHS